MNQDEEYNAFKKTLENALEAMVESEQYECDEDIVAEAIDFVNDWHLRREESEIQEARDHGVSLPSTQFVFSHVRQVNNPIRS